MKAVSVKGPGDVQIIEIHKPQIGPRDVLAKVKYCGLCGTDISIISGDTSLIRDGLVKYPVRIGHEWSGIVEAVGDEVVGFKPGDPVVGDDGVACGNCQPCMEGNPDLCEYLRGVGTVFCWDGAFADYIVMPFRQMYKLSEKIDLDEAALLEPAGIAYNGLLKSNIRPGQTLLIIGTGPIGLAAVNLAKCMGVTKVILSGRKDIKLDIGRKMGAEVVVNANNEDLVEVVMKHTDGKGADAIIETSGNIVTVNQSLDAVKAGGNIALIGFYETNLNGFNIDKLTVKSVTLRGVAGTPNIFPTLIKMLDANQINLKPLITDIYEFKDIHLAIKAVHEKNDTRVKILVKID